MLLIFFCCLIAVNSVLGGQVRLYPIGRYPASPEVDSSEHGVTRGSRSTNCECGWANRPKKNSATTRIVGGTEVQPNEYPFLAGVAESYSRYNPHCGGVIISPWLVLTAAHCTADAHTLVVTVGEHDRIGREEEPIVIYVDKIIDHENFNSTEKNNDISLLTLDEPIPMDKNVGPACLPSGPLDLVDQHVRVIGWGARGHYLETTPVPHKVDLRVVSMETCSRAWDYHIRSSPATQICTHSRKKTACQGDSGGPVVWLDPETNRYTVVGLVSFGSFCTDERPSIQSSVVYHLPWIHAKIQEHMPGQQTCSKV